MRYWLHIVPKLHDARLDAQLLTDFYQSERSVVQISLMASRITYIVLKDHMLSLFAIPFITKFRRLGLWDMAQWLESRALPMSLPAVLIRIPLGAGFSKKYHVSPLSILGHC